MKITVYLRFKAVSWLFMLAILAVCVGQPTFLKAADYKVSTTEIAYPTKQIAIEFMTKVYAELGHQLTIEEYPQGRALIESNAGHVDGELFRVAGINNEYKNLIQIPDPISFSRIFAYVNKDSNLSPNNWADLKGLRVGYVMGVKVVEAKLKGTMAVTVNRPEQLFYMLKNNRLDVAIYVATRAKILEGVIPIETPLLKVPVYHYIHNKNKQLVAPLQGVIQRLTEQGELARIMSSSMVGTYPNLETRK